MNKFSHYIKEKSPVLLAVAGCIASTAAVGMAIHDTLKAVEKCPEEDSENSRGEIFKKVAPCYAPTVTLWAVSIACICGSTALSSKEKASLIGAYMLLNKTYSDYIAKNKDLYGDLNHETIVEEMAKDRYRSTSHPREEDTKLYYEGYYGEYFESTPAKVLRAEFELNRMLIRDEMVTFGDFLDLLDLPRTEASDLGWSTWQMFDFCEGCGPWIEVRHDPVLMDDGLECEILEFVVAPAPDFYEEF